MVRFYGTLFILLIAIWIQLIEGRRILLIPGQLPEDIYPLHAMGDALMEKGHDVFTVLADKTDMDSIYMPYGLQTLQYTTPDDLEAFTSDTWSTDHLSKLTLIEKYITGTIKSLHSKHCTAILNNQDFLQTIRDTNFDIALVHGSALTRCHFIIAHACKLPFVYVSSHVELSVSRITVLPSFVPHYNKPFTWKMTFTERILNLGAYLKPDIEFWQDTAMLKNYKTQIDSRVTEMHDLLRMSSFFIITSDSLLDYPTPSMPHLIQQRGITFNVGKKNGIEEESETKNSLDQTASSIKGTIVISLGTTIDVYPETLFKAISTLSEDYRLVVLQRKLVGKIDSALYAPYKNRNHVFNHKSAKLLITSGNHEDQTEALSCGLPVVTIPLYADDFHNARRIEQRYLGRTIYLGKNKYKIADITKIIVDTMYNQTIRDNAKEISELMNAYQTNDLWINTLENVIKYGDSHIRSIALDMPLHHYAMLDMLAIICLIAIITFGVLSRIVMYILRIILTKVVFLIFRIIVGVIRLLVKILTLGRGKNKKE